ncbi:MAG TPA: RNA polymerase sigma factor SigI [Streptosporangiaceae bacterium]|nr:RNA polymerase sigma factor SigI [Streptosporangiaceae bacterium]
MRDDAKISLAYQQNRPYLVDLAFRMLGDIGAAQDTVQDAFSRLLRTELDEIEDLRGWLIVVTSRLCLDQIRSARTRRERAHDATEIEFVPGEPASALGSVARPELADPADRVTFDDTVSLALLVVLQRLSPAERCVFVLHDIFRMPFDEVAQTVGRTVVSCRQLARRARQKITSGQDAVRFDVASAEHRQVTDTFIAACASGDLHALLSVLAPDAWGMIDFGPGAVPRQITETGADRIAANLLAFWGPPATLVSHPIAGQPALLGFNGRDLAGVLVFAMRGELIESITVVGDPRKLADLASQLVTFPRGISSLPEELMLRRKGEEKQ